MKRALVVLAIALTFVGCKKESVENVSTSWKDSRYLEVLTQIKNPEKPDYLIIDQDLILYDKNDKKVLKEFYRDTKTFIGDSDKFEERYGYYHVKDLVNLTTPDSKWAWTETDDVKEDRYSELKDAFVKCKDILKLDSSTDKELVFTANVKGSDLKPLHNYFEDVGEDEDVDLRFYISKISGKYLINRLYLNGKSGEKERLKESYVMNIDKENSINIPKSLALHMMTNGYKIDKENAITTKEEAERKGYKQIN